MGNLIRKRKPDCINCITCFNFYVGTGKERVWMCTYSFFKKMGQPWPLFMFIFLFLSNTILQKNCRLQQDSNSDRRIRRRARWPFDHHHGTCVCSYSCIDGVRITCVRPAVIVKTIIEVRKLTKFSCYAWSCTKIQNNSILNHVNNV